jgi:hypothetical protein
MPSRLLFSSDIDEKLRKFIKLNHRPLLVLEDSALAINCPSRVLLVFSYPECCYYYCYCIPGFKLLLLLLHTRFQIIIIVIAQRVQEATARDAPPVNIYSAGWPCQPVSAMGLNFGIAT